MATVDWHGEDLTDGHEEVRFEITVDCPPGYAGEDQNPCDGTRQTYHTKDSTYDARDGLHVYVVGLSWNSPGVSERVEVVATTYSWPVADATGPNAGRGGSKTFAFTRTTDEKFVETCQRRGAHLHGALPVTNDLADLPTPARPGTSANTPSASRRRSRGSARSAWGATPTGGPSGRCTPATSTTSSASSSPTRQNTSPR